MTLNRRMFLAPDLEMKALAERLLQELRNERTALERQESQQNATDAVRVGHDIHPISRRELQLLERTWDWFEDMHPQSVTAAQESDPSGGVCSRHIDWT